LSSICYAAKIVIFTCINLMYIYQIETLFSNNIFCLNLELTCDYCNYYNSIDVCLALTTINFYLTLPILIIEAKCLHRLFGHCLDYV